MIHKHLIPIHFECFNIGVTLVLFLYYYSIY